MVKYRWQTERMHRTYDEKTTPISTYIYMLLQILNSNSPIPLAKQLKIRTNFSLSFAMMRLSAHKDVECGRAKIFIHSKQLIKHNESMCTYTCVYACVCVCTLLVTWRQLFCVWYYSIFATNEYGKIFNLISLFYLLCERQHTCTHSYNLYSEKCSHSQL